jgi:hypothetical protein
MKNYLDSIAEYLLAHPKAQMIIVGNPGLADSGKTAKETSLNDLIACLINRGIDPNRIVARSESANKHIPLQANFNFRKRQYKLN